MTQEEKDLVLQDICARLPYGVICQGICEIWDIDEEYYTHEFHKTIIVDGKLQGIQFNKASIDGNICNVETVKPYLRPMSSMTEEEQKEFAKFHCVNICPIVIIEDLTISNEAEMFEWLNKKMFDYHGLIPKDLALSTEGYNPYKD